MVNGVLDQKTLIEVVELLDACFSSRVVVRSDLQQKLSQMENLNNNVEFNFYVLHILSKGRELNVTTEIRQAAGLLIKNNVRKLYRQLPNELIMTLRKTLLPLLADSDFGICKTAANIISILALESEYQWSELLPTLFGMIDTRNENSMEAVFRTLSNICEDFILIYRYSEDDTPQNRILIYLVSKLSEFIQNIHISKYQAIALSCINRFLPDTYELCFKYVPNLLNILFTISEHNSPEIKKNICIAFHTLIVVGNTLDPFLNNIFKYMIKRVENVNEYDVALEATEFWVTVVESEMHNNLVESLLSEIVPIFIVNAKYSQKDFEFGEVNRDGTRNEYDIVIKPTFRKDKNHGAQENVSVDHSWTLRKASASAIDKFSHYFHSSILPIIFYHLQRMMLSEDWIVKESIILVLGAIAEGCSREANQYFIQTMPFIIKCLDYPTNIIRGNTLWTIGRYAHCLTHPNNTAYLGQAIRAILAKVIDPSHTVQTAALYSLSILVESGPAYCSHSSHDILAVVLSIIGAKIHEDTAIAFYDTLAVMFDYMPGFIKEPVVKEKIIPILINTWIGKVDSLKRSTIPLMECIITIISSMREDFHPYLQQVFVTCHKIIHFTCKAIGTGEITEEEDKDYMVLSMDIISTCLEKLTKYTTPMLKVYDIIPFIPIIAKEKSLSVKQCFYSLIGELSKTNFDYIANLNMELLELLSLEITGVNEIFTRDAELMKVHNNAIWAFGELILRSDSSQTFKYIVPIFPQLSNYIKSRTVINVIQDNCVLCVCYCGIFWPQPVMQAMSDSFELLCKYVKRITLRDEEKILSILGLGNMASTAPDISAQYLTSLFDTFNSLESHVRNQQVVDCFNKLITKVRQYVGEDAWIKYWDTSVDPHTKNLLQAFYGVS